jgi:hypothetical protein
MFYSQAEYYPQQSVGQFRSTKGSPKQITELVLSGYLPSICHPTVTLNVDKTRGLGGYRFDLHVEDVDLWWRMALQHDVRMITAVTVGFRQNAQSVSSTNLEAQALNTLYVQYLLLSHLWGCEPLSYEEAREPLTSLCDRRRLRFKANLRSMNMEMGQGRMSAALWKGGCAFAASPRDFTRRLLDEFVPNRIIGLGERPSCFAEMESILWPAASGSSSDSTTRRSVQGDRVNRIQSPSSVSGQVI